MFDVRVSNRMCTEVDYSFSIRGLKSVVRLHEDIVAVVRMLT